MRENVVFNFISLCGSGGSRRNQGWPNMGQEDSLEVVEGFVKISRS